MALNLIDEPWVPVETATGRVAAVGLGDLFEGSATLRNIWHGSPLVYCSLHRLLLAIVHRAIGGPATRSAWSALWLSGRFPADVHRYLTAWSHRFDLFDPLHPFFQTQALEGAKTHPAELLAAEFATGNNASFFDHHIASNPTGLPPADAALYLLATQAFAIGFGKSTPFYFSDAPLTRGATVTLRGRNLFETIILNLDIYSDTSGRDMPLWERDWARDPDPAGTLPDGRLDYLTWQSRRVHLIQGRNQQGELWVPKCQVLQGLRLSPEISANPMRFERHQAFVADGGIDGFRPLSMRAERALWRDSHTLLMRSEAIGTRPPPVVEAAREAPGLEMCQLDVVGLAMTPGKAARIALWRQERLPVHLSALSDPERELALVEALRYAEGVKDALVRALWRYGRGVLSRGSDERAQGLDRDDVGGLVRHGGAESTYWGALGPSFFAFLENLGTQGEVSAASWHHMVEDAAWAALGTITDTAAPTPASMKARVLARRTLGAGIRSLKEEGVADAG